MSNNGENPCILKLTPSEENTELVKVLKKSVQSTQDGLFLNSNVIVLDYRFQLVLEDKAGANLETYFCSKRANASFSDTEAISIYIEQAQALNSIGVHAFHSDAKNTNWLINDGKLTIADCKGIVARETPPSFFSAHTCPFEFDHSSASKLTAENVEKIHVYELGINMIECFSGNKVDSITRANIQNFKGLYQEFKGSRNNLLKAINDAGLKRLLQRCVADAPQDRPTLGVVIQGLELIKERNMLIEEINNKIGLLRTIKDTHLDTLSDVSDDLESSTATLRKLNRAPHLNEFYAIINKLKTKSGSWVQSPGSVKAEAVMKKFVMLSIEDRLNPYSNGWGDVMEALKVKRGMLESVSFKQFNAALDKAKNTQNSNGTTNDATKKGP
jgi:hypothetical protein